MKGIVYTYVFWFVWVVGEMFCHPHVVASIPTKKGRIKFSFWEPRLVQYSILCALFLLVGVYLGAKMFWFCTQYVPDLSHVTLFFVWYFLGVALQCIASLRTAYADYSYEIVLALIEILAGMGYAYAFNLLTS